MAYAKRRRWNSCAACMSKLADPKYKILVVGDDVYLNTTFALMLAFDEHEIRTVSSGEAALAMLEKTKFDLIVTEYWLPQMKGDELAALVKQEWPDQPIILVTANIEDLNKDDQPITGVDCLLNKPLSMSQLRDAIIGVLDPRAGSRQSGLETHGVHTATLRNPTTRKTHQDRQRH